MAAKQGYLTLPLAMLDLPVQAFSNRPKLKPQTFICGFNFGAPMRPVVEPN
jgi:hypothetical protein